MTKPNRHLLLYVTLDPHDHRKPDGSAGAHEGNFRRVSDVAAGWRADVVTEHLWCEELTEDRLNDPRLLALFLSGSFTEWTEVFRQPHWKTLLENYAAKIRDTEAPVLAVCGSHQWLAAVYGGWEAVAHLAPLGESPIRIVEEMDGVCRAPSPRIGEVGSFGFRRARPDPILDGLPEHMQFAEWHYDQVLESALPEGVVSLLKPDGLENAVQEDVGPNHRKILSPKERCRIQALRYHVRPEGRVLYSTQFHPDLAHSPGSLADTHGRIFLQNFLHLAECYWETRKLQ